MLTELRKKQIQRLALGLNDTTKLKDESAPMLLQDMVYYNPFAANLGALRMSLQDLNPNVWYMSQVSKTFLYKELHTINGAEFSMLRCPKGSFDMTGYYDENIYPALKHGNRPARKTNIELPFFLGETEVTEKLYYAVVGDEHDRKRTDTNHTPKSVLWYDAIEFCNALSDLQGLDRCYTPSKNIILFRDYDPKKSKNKKADAFYDEIIKGLKDLGIENVYLDTEVDDDTVINNPFYLVHAGAGGASSRFDRIRDRLKLRPAINLTSYLGSTTYRIVNDTAFGLKKVFEYVKQNPICDPTKNGYRLPMEKEWEYAARAGTGNEWAGTNSLDRVGEYAWFWDNSSDKDEEGRHIGFSTKNVKMKRPNEWGFYDMSGHVEEYCNDIYEYDTDSTTFFSRYGFPIYYVLRGGYIHSQSPKITTRNGGRYSGSRVGFRIARTIIE